MPDLLTAILAAMVVDKVNEDKPGYKPFLPTGTILNPNLTGTNQDPFDSGGNYKK